LAEGGDNHVCLAEKSYTRTAQECRIVARKVNRGEPASRYPGQTSHTYYYSKGVTAAYNGSGYTTYNTFQSPNLYF